MPEQWKIVLLQTTEGNISSIYQKYKNLQTYDMFCRRVSEVQFDRLQTDQLPSKGNYLDM